MTGRRSGVFGQFQMKKYDAGVQFLLVQTSRSVRVARIPRGVDFFLEEFAFR